jgi:hypothetical protein
MVAAAHLLDMNRLKDQANTLRSRLDAKDIGIWHRLTSFTNLTGDVVFQIKRRYEPELCTIAWAKMFEILSRYSILDAGPKVRTAHVCEAPGGFIAATNHYLRLKYRDALEWQWSGMTLNPYYEDNDNEAMVEDDQVSLNFIMFSFYLILSSSSTQSPTGALEPTTRETSCLPPTSKPHGIDWDRRLILSLGTAASTVKAIPMSKR